MFPAPSGSSWEKLLTHLSVLEDFGLIVLIFPSANEANRWQAALSAYSRENGRSLPALGPFDSASVLDLANRLLEYPVNATDGALWLPLYHPADAPDAALWPAALTRALTALNHTRTSRNGSPGRSARGMRASS